MLIVEYERITPGLKLNDLLNDLNIIYFENVMKLSKEPVTSREKAIILGLLGLMAISDDYSLRPKKDNKNYIKAAVDVAAKFIESFGKDPLKLTGESTADKEREKIIEELKDTQAQMPAPQVPQLTPGATPEEAVAPAAPALT